MNSIKQILSSAISRVLDKLSQEQGSNANVITSSRPEFGDYQANGVMAIAKRLKINPRELAQQALELLAEDENFCSIVEKMEVAGPGFINLHVSADYLGKRGNKLAAESSLLATVEKSQRIVVDYSSPNLAKEMHVGHLRGTIIGDCLVRVLESQGHDLIRQNHVGDWGTQFGMLITQMKDLHEESQQALPVELSDLESFYRQAKQRFDSDPGFADRARANVVKLQGGDTEFLRVWRQFIDESLSHCEAVYEKLNITLTRKDLKPESFYNNELENIVNLLDDKGLLSISDGARCVFQEEFKGKEGEPLPVIVQKSDGGYLYATTDLAAVQYRAKNLAAERSLYVVDARQSLHFQQVFSLAKKAGLATAGISLEHIAYGTMMGADGKPFKTRSGGIVKLIDLLDEAVVRAFTLVSEKSPKLPEAERQNIAAKVGIAAVKYAELSKNRTSDYIFDWGTMLSFEGNTAPYLLYAYARIKSILRKSELEQKSAINTADMEVAERRLLMKALQLPEIVEAVANECFPNQLCNYLYELASTFMRFYEACPILKAEDRSTQQSRLALADFTATTLKQGLDLLGIEVLEKM